MFLSKELPFYYFDFVKYCPCLCVEPELEYFLLTNKDLLYAVLYFLKFILNWLSEKYKMILYNINLSESKD